MEPLFDWSMEEEGQRDLKALHYVISWFGRAEEAVAEEVDRGRGSYITSTNESFQQYSNLQRPCHY